MCRPHQQSTVRLCSRWSIVAHCRISASPDCNHRKPDTRAYTHDDTNPAGYASLSMIHIYRWHQTEHDCEKAVQCVFIVILHIDPILAVFSLKNPRKSRCSRRDSLQTEYKSWGKSSSKKCAVILQASVEMWKLYRETIFVEPSLINSRHMAHYGCVSGLLIIRLNQLTALALIGNEHCKKRAQRINSLYSVSFQSQFPVADCNIISIGLIYCSRFTCGLNIRQDLTVWLR